MRYLILTVAGFGDYEGVELAAVRLDADTLAWLRSLLARPWRAGIRSARLTAFPDAIEFVNLPADPDDAWELSERLSDDNWLVVGEVEREHLTPFVNGVNSTDVEILLDGRRTATAVQLIAGIDFWNIFVEGFTRRELTLDLLREVEAADAAGPGAASC